MVFQFGDATPSNLSNALGGYIVRSGRPSEKNDTYE